MDKFKKFLFYLPPLYLIFHYTSTGMNRSRGMVSITDFQNYRNQFYSLELAIPQILPSVIISLILTTFSYAIAGIIVGAFGFFLK